MKLLVGNEDVTRKIISKIGKARMVLFKFGNGSGGALLMKQIFEKVPEGTYSVFVSTHQSEKDILEEFADMGIEKTPDIVSLLPEFDSRLSDIRRRDRFVTDGIMVTDLLEISSHNSEKVVSRNPRMRILSIITDISSKQVLPFRMVMDSLPDLVEETSKREVVDRLRILKGSLRENGGMVLVGCPLDYVMFSDLDSTLFDAVIEVKADKRGDAWFRSLTFMNVKGSGEPPEEFSISQVKEIPTALAVD